MSTSKPIDISTLKFTAPIDEDEDLEDDSESEDSYDDEFPFMKVISFQFFHTATDPFFTTGVQIHDNGPKSSTTSC